MMRRTKRFLGLLMALLMLASMAIAAPVASAADEEVKTTVDNVKALAGGEAHSLALIGGSLFAWGDNSSGQVGNGTNKNASKPVQILDYVVSIAAGRDFSAAVTSDGKLYTWGSNAKGQLATGNTTNVNKPTAVKSNETFVAVSAGYNHLVALTKDGKLFGAGGNNFGQLTGTSTADKKTITQIGSGYVKAVAGRYTTFGITSAGALFGTGYNQDGRLGLGDFVNRTAFAPVMASVANVASGYDGTFALTTSNELYVFGKNDENALGLGNSTTYVETPFKLSIKAKSVAGGQLNSMAVGVDGTLYTWGAGPYGELGNGTSGAGAKQGVPTSVGSGYVYGAAGYTHRLALKNDGKIYTWGSNNKGQLGTGKTSGETKPAAIKFTGSIVDPPDPTDPETPEEKPAVLSMRSLTQLVDIGEDTTIEITANTATTIVKVTNPSDTEVWGTSKTFEEKKKTIDGKEVDCHVFTVTFPLAKSGLYQIRLYAGQIIDGKNKYNNATDAILRLTVRAFSSPIAVSIRTDKTSYDDTRSNMNLTVLTDVHTQKVKITDVNGNTLAETDKPSRNVNGYMFWELKLKPYVGGIGIYYAYASIDGKTYEEKDLTKRAYARIQVGKPSTNMTIIQATVDKFDAGINETYTYTVETMKYVNSISLYDEKTGEHIVTVNKHSSTMGDVKVWTVPVKSDKAGKYRYLIGGRSKADGTGDMGALYTTKYTTVK